jgi:hypothetical protein
MDWTAVSARSKILHVMSIVVRRLAVAGWLVFSLGVAAAGVLVPGQPPAGTPAELVRVHALEADVIRWFAAHAGK